MALSATKNMSVCPTSSEPAAVVCGVTLEQAKVKLQHINTSCCCMGSYIRAVKSETATHQQQLLLYGELH